MQFVPTDLPGVVLVEPTVFGDDRGFFFEAHHSLKYADAGLDLQFVQDNHSSSSHGVLRGLHAQRTKPQGKLVRALVGAIFDVAVDIRPSSPHFGQWVGAELSSENHHLLYIPPGFAHGFVVTSERAEVEYKCTDHHYAPEDEIVVLWNDPALGIAWPVEQPTLADRDRDAPTLEELRPSLVG